MKKNLLLGLAGAAMLIGCQHNACCRSCGSAGGPAQGVGQMPSSTTSSLAGRPVQTTPQQMTAQQMTPQSVAPQQTMPQSSGMVMPNAMSARPAAAETMTR